MLKVYCCFRVYPVLVWDSLGLADFFSGWFRVDLGLVWGSLKLGLWLI